MLYSSISHISAADEAEVILFLESEWGNECLEYPGQVPDFDADAALWAARTIYTAAQLMLYRKDRSEALQALLPPFAAVPTAGCMLSADLCLRMLPPLLVQLAAIDPDDAIISILEARLDVWHYSGIGYKTPIEIPDFSLLLPSTCAMQLYTDRVIARKDAVRAALPAIAPFINAAMGDLRNHFWK